MEYKRDPKRGERGDFVKMTITLPLDMIIELKKISLERLARSNRDSNMSSIIREAVYKFIFER